MDSGVIAVIIFGIIFLILIPFIYYGIKMAGYNKAAGIVSITIFLVVMIPLIKYGYRSKMYSSVELKVDLHKAGIGFKNPIKIVSNDVSGIKIKKQETRFIMDTVDVNKIISRIESNSHYKIVPKLINLKADFGSKAQQRRERNYRFKNFYILETYGKIDDYTVRYTELKFRKNNDTVFFVKEEVY
jgi:hypothetical protein